MQPAAEVPALALSCRPLASGPSGPTGGMGRTPWAALSGPELPVKGGRFPAPHPGVSSSPVAAEHAGPGAGRAGLPAPLGSHPQVSGWPGPSRGVAPPRAASAGGREGQPDEGGPCSSRSTSQTQRECHPLHDPPQAHQGWEVLKCKEKSRQQHPRPPGMPRPSC